MRFEIEFLIRDFIIVEAPTEEEAFEEAQEQLDTRAEILGIRQI